MTGSTHCLIAQLALENLSPAERAILEPRWESIEAGATLSDHFRIMWEQEEPGSKDKQLVHRCYVDSTDIKNHGCITRALDYTQGTISFIEAYLEGQLEGAYSEEEFLENLGMFLGVASHHIADLCTPVHVGHKIDPQSFGYPSLSRLHTKVERDIQRFSKNFILKPVEYREVIFTKEYFWQIAKETYDNYFLLLPEIYTPPMPDKIKGMATDVVTSATKHTINTWKSTMSSTNMLERIWSTEPLV